MAGKLQVVGFRVGQELFAIPIEAVHEIVRVPTITAVPDSPRSVAGVMNLRGKIIPVIDLRVRLGVEPVADGKNRVLVVEVGARKLGLIVDEACDVIKVPEEQIERVPEVFDPAEVRFVVAIAKLHDRLLLLLDLPRIVASAEDPRRGPQAAGSPEANAATA
jgi:purine-binding chemotaxis protein CheW